MRVRIKKVVGPLVVILGALGASFVISYSLRSQPSPPASKAFVAEGFVRRFATKGDGGPSKVSQTTFARKGDGSWAEITTTESPSGQVGELRTFWDVASHREVTLEPATKSTMTYFLTANEMRVKLEDSESCPPSINAASAQHERILGYDVVKVTEEDAGPHGSEQLIESWVAPQLGCYALRRSEVRSDGPHNEVETTRVTEAKPPAWMFEVPADYVERSPSQLSADWAAKFGQGFLPDDIIATMDRNYYAHRR